MDRTTALGTPLRDLAGWHLIIDCATCRMLRQVDVDRLPGQDRIVSDMLPRLRCRKCGAEPCGVKLANAHRFTAQTVVEVVLVSANQGHGQA
jgi:hypothetical protein